MSHGGIRRLRRIGVLAAALCASACASTGRFVRPAVDAGPVITDEATGRTFTDCREAFAAATFDTVLTFSAGVFPCGPEVTSSAPFLVVRGAGLVDVAEVDDVRGVVLGDEVDDRVRRPVVHPAVADRPDHDLRRSPGLVVAAARGAQGERARDGDEEPHPRQR